MPQIAEAVNRETVLIFDPLFRKPLDMPREITPCAQVQLVPGHAPVDIDRTRDRLGDVFDGRHESQRIRLADVPCAALAVPVCRDSEPRFDDCGRNVRG